MQTVRAVCALGWFCAISQTHNKDHPFLMMQRHSHRNWTSVNYWTSKAKETETSEMFGTNKGRLGRRKGKQILRADDADNMSWCLSHLLRPGQPTGQHSTAPTSDGPVGLQWLLRSVICLLSVHRFLLCFILPPIHNLLSASCAYGTCPASAYPSSANPPHTWSMLVNATTAQKSCQILSY